MKEYPIINMYQTGQKIKQIMQRRGLTVRDIQEYLGLVTPQSIYHWFHGRNMPTVDNFYALSELFQLPVDVMLCGNRKMNYDFVRCTSYYHLYLYNERVKSLKVG